MKSQLISELKNYSPFNGQEEKDITVLIDLLENEKNIYLRTNLAYHMTASAWVVNKTCDKVLMCYHNIYHSWSWLGGHADGEEDLKAVALKEVREESGLKNIRLLSDDIFSVEILTVDGHNKKGSYVPSHLHLNVTYLIEADETEKMSVKEDENSNLAWFDPDEAIEKSTESWFKERVYPKLNEKLKLFISCEK